MIKVTNQSLSTVKYLVLAGLVLAGLAITSVVQAQSVLNANTVLKVDRDRICSEWLSCATALEVGEQTLCFEQILCAELDPTTGACLKYAEAPTAEQIFTLQSGLPNSSTISNASLLSGHSKVGASWQGFNVDGSVAGLYHYANMAQVGSSLTVPNGDFESRGHYPWQPRFYQPNSSQVVAQTKNTEDRTDLKQDLNRVLEVRPVINNINQVSGVEVPLGRSIRPGNYYVTLDIRSDDPRIAAAIVQFGFHNYQNFQGYATADVPISSNWERVTVGPLEVQTGDLPDLGEQTYLGILFNLGSLSNTEPLKSFFIDNVRIEPVLQVNQTNQVATSCRIYASDDAPSCSYFDLNSGRNLQGWQGYCVETDPRNPRRCLQWLPIDLVAGASPLLAKYAQAGYADRLPLYYCTAAKGNAPYVRNLGEGSPLLLGNATVLLSKPGFPSSGWNGPSGINYYSVGNLIGPGITTGLQKSEIEQIVIYIKETEADDWPSGGFSLNRENDFEVAWCGGPGCPSRDSLYNQGWARWVDSDQNDGYCDTDENNGAFNLFGIKARFDSSNYYGDNDPNTLDSLRAGLCDGSRNTGWFVADVIIYLREWCTEVAQVVTPFGANTAWVGRVADEAYVVPNLSYDYNRDWQPFGGIVAPAPDFDPSRWDSSIDELGRQPLYVEPANKQQFFEEPHQARSSSPYGIAGDPNGPTTIGKAVCVSGDGSRIGKNCAKHSDCGFNLESGGSGRCTGVVVPELALDENDFLNALNTFQGELTLSEIFARSQQVWQWDEQAQQYVSSGTLGCETSGLCPNGTGWDITGQVANGEPVYAKPPQVDNLILKVNGISYTDSSQVVQVNASHLVAAVTFNSIVDTEQVPLVRYTVDWDDGTVSEEANLKIGPQFNPSQPHVLTHTYTASGSYQPKVQVEDNWGWCSGSLRADGSPVRINSQFVDNYTGTGITCDSWNFTASILLDTTTAAPSNLSASYSQLSGQVAVTWNDVIGETGYSLERSVNSAAWQPLPSLGANTTYYADNNVAQGSTYSYRVRATLAPTGYTNYSNIDSVTIQVSASTGATVFVTSASHNGDLYDWSQGLNGCGGLTQGNSNANEIANCICTQYAAQSSLTEPGEWHAWLSYRWPGGSLSCGPATQPTLYNANRNVRSDFNQSIDLIRTDDQVVVNNLSQLSSGSLQRPINLDQNGALVNADVWTGTTAAGTCQGASLSTDCGLSAQPYTAWGSNTTSERGIYGSSDAINGSWTTQGNPWLPGDVNAGCERPKHLYCIWYDSDIPPAWGGSPGPVADFAGSPVSGPAPLTVSFTDLSQPGEPPSPIESWLWTFGDGGSSPAPNPTHTYTSLGTYTVGLEIMDSQGRVASEGKTNYITVSGDTIDPVVNSFNISPGSVIIDWNVTDSGGSYLDNIQIWRAPDSGGSPGVWTELTTLRVNLATQNLNSHSGSATDNPADGTWWYGLHVYDQAGNIGYEPASLSIIVTSPDIVVPVVESFSLRSRTNNDPATFDWSVSDNQDLQAAALWRTSDQGGVPNQSGWTLVEQQTVSGVSASGTFTDVPTDGSWWYGLQALDAAGNTGYEPNPPGPLPLVKTTLPPPDTIPPVVESFVLQPRAAADAAVFNWTVSDETALSQVALWRAADAGGLPGTWQLIASQPASGTSLTGSFTDNPPDGGWWYSLHAMDAAGNTGLEPNPPGPISLTKLSADITAPVVNSFTLQPRNQLQPATFNWSVSDNRSLSVVTLRRVSNGGGPVATWTSVASQPVSGTSANGQLLDNPPDGNWLYSLQVTDSSSNTGVEPNPPGPLSLYKTSVDEIAPLVGEFALRPRTNAESVVFDWSVSDETGLQTVEFWRSPDNGGQPDQWILLSLQNVSGTSASGSFSDNPPVGTWWYGMHVVDLANNIGYEPVPPGPIQIVKVVSTDISPPQVTSFTLRPRAQSDPAVFDWIITDETALRQAELWRAPDSAGRPGTWQIISTVPVSGVRASGTFTNNPTDGAWWYGIHAVDTGGNVGVEPNPPGALQVIKAAAPGS